MSCQLGARRARRPPGASMARCRRRARVAATALTQLFTDGVEAATRSAGPRSFHFATGGFVPARLAAYSFALSLGHNTGAGRADGCSGVLPAQEGTLTSVEPPSYS